MTIKLRGSTDGSVSLTAPADTSPTGTDITLTLPTDAGSANQFLKNSGTAGTLDYSSMVEDSSGNIGIGTASPSNMLHIEGSSPSIRLKVTSGPRHMISPFSGDLYIESDPDNTSASTNTIFTVDGNERMRINSSGKILIGSDTESALGDRLLQVGKTDRSSTYVSIVNSTSGVGGLLFADSTGSGDGGYRGQIDYLHSSDVMRFYTAATERMRISANGTFDSHTTDGTFNIRTSRATGSGTDSITLKAGTGDINGGTITFKVLAKGDVYNQNQVYGQISDIKFKENVVDSSSQWSDIKSLRVRNFNFKEGDTHTQIGLIAQEVELVSPGLVDELTEVDEEGNELDTTTKTVKYSVLYMKAVKALQEAMDRIETLEAKVATLEAAE